MNTVVLPVTDVSAIPMNLLLCADPGMEPAMNYLHKASFFGAYLFSRLVAICALVETDPGIGKIITISVTEAQKTPHIVTSLLKRGIQFAKISQWKALYIETANSSLESIKTYQSMGFLIDSIDHGFFTRNNESSIVENGIRCTDKISLKISFEGN